MKIEELFGTLQQSVVSAWRKHLRTHKYSKHIALNEFYEEMPEKVDALIEAWMGANGKKVNSFTNLIQSRNMNTLMYLKELRRVVKEGYPLMNGEKELEALMDDIVELIDSTLYKVKELSENNGMKDLKDFINESLKVNEAMNPKKTEKLIQNMYDDDGDLVSVASCFHWLDELNWEKMTSTQYAQEINEINDDIDYETAELRYTEVMIAMASIGRDKTLNIIKKIVDDESELEDYDIK